MAQSTFIFFFAIAMMLLVSCNATPTTVLASRESHVLKRDIPDPNTVIKLAQNGLRNMMVVAKLTADNELNLLQPKKPKGLDNDTSDFGVSANPPSVKKPIDVQAPKNG